MSQNLQNFVKFQKFQLDNLVDFEKCCKTRILLAKIGADKAENERHFAQNLQKKIGNYPTGNYSPGRFRSPRPGAPAAPPAPAQPSHTVPAFGESFGMFARCC